MLDMEDDDWLCLPATFIASKTKDTIDTCR